MSEPPTQWIRYGECRPRSRMASTVCPVNGIGLSHLRLKVSALVSERQFEDADRLRGVVTAGKSGFPDPRVHLLRVASGVCAPGMKKAVIGAPALVDGADAENAPRSHLPDGERPLCHLLPSGGDQHSKTGNGAHCRRTSALRRLSFRGCSCARALSGPARGPCAAEPPLIGGDSPPVSGPDGDQIQIVTSRFRSVTKAPTGIEPVYTALQAAA